MSRAIALVVLLSIVAAVSGQSLCDKYSAALSFNNSQLISFVVDSTITSVTSNAVTKRYFDGSLGVQWPTAPNFLNNTAALTTLRTNLITFFGLALNCTDNSIGPYTGRDMYTAHISMPIGLTQFESFNRQLVGILSANGVSAADSLAVLALLNSLKPQVCNQASCNNFPTISFCDRYSQALNTTEYDLIDTVVQGVLVNVTSTSSPLRRFFDGSIPNTRNFVSNPALYNTLRIHLTEWFGLGNVLNCSYVNYPAYTGATLVQSHANLRIDVASFNLFNQVLLNILAGAGVAQPDLNAATALLQSTQSAIVTVTNTTTTTGSTGTTTSRNTGTTTSRTTTTGAITGAAASGSSSTSGASTLFVSVFAIFLVLAVYLF